MSYETENHLEQYANSKASKDVHSGTSEVVLDAKYKKAIEILEDPDFDLNIEAKINILLVKEGLKPTSTFHAQENISQPLMKILNNLDLQYHASGSQMYDDKLDKNVAAYYFIVSKEEKGIQDEIDNLVRFNMATKHNEGAKDEEDIQIILEDVGKNYGYPDTATRAFAREEERFDRNDLPQDVKDSEVGQLIQRLPLLKMSKEHWPSELEQYSQWFAKIKEVSPRLFEQVLSLDNNAK